jgi:hypothetical protein
VCVCSNRLKIQNGEADTTSIVRKDPTKAITSPVETILIVG